MTILNPQQYNQMMLERVQRAAQRTAQLRALSLRDFIRQAWHVVEPQTKYIPGWHIDAISDHLEAVTRSEIRRLIINIPPGMMKSLSVSVFWPVWMWTFKPHLRFLTASYALSLATRDSLKSRRLIQSQWYQSRWGSVFQLTGDQNQKTRYENDKTGFRLAVSVGGATGERADARIIDDPHNIDDAYGSDVSREGVIDWYKSVWSEREADSRTGVEVVIMQRLHERDLSGYLLSELGGYEHLMLPMRFEAERRCVTAIGFSDPRQCEDELLCPARHDEEAVQDKEKRLGSYGAAGQLQQRPAPRGGGMFKREWFEIVSAAPRQAARVRYWDKAATEEGQGSTSFTCGVLIARDTQGAIYIEDIVRGQWASAQREIIIKQVAETDAIKYGQHEVRIWVEQEPGSGGKDSALATIKNLSGFIVHADRVTGSKELRADPLASQAGAGNVRIVRAEWNHDFLERLILFPHGTYKDEIDAAAGAFNHLPRQVVETYGVLEETTKPQPSAFNRTGNVNRWGKNKPKSTGRRW